MAQIEARFGESFTPQQIEHTTSLWMRGAKEHKFSATIDESIRGRMAEIYFLSGDNPELAATLCRKLEQVLQHTDFTVRIIGDKLDLEYVDGELR